MNKTTKTVLSILGVSALTLVLYLNFSDEPPSDDAPVPIVENDSTANEIFAPVVIKEDSTSNEIIGDSISTPLPTKKKLQRIAKTLGMGIGELVPTQNPNVFTTIHEDKIIVFEEDVWKTILNKAQRKFPNLAESCSYKSEYQEFWDYEFVGILSYLAEQESKNIMAYQAREIYNGKANCFAGGEICCGVDCDGQPLVPISAEVVIDNKLLK